MADPLVPSTVEAPSPSTDAELAPPSTPPSAPSAPAQPDWWAALEQADQKELAKHPTVSGLVGTLAERQAKKAVEKALAERDAQDAERNAQAAAKAEKERIHALLEEDASYGAKGASEILRITKETDLAKMRADKQLSDLQAEARTLIGELGLTPDDLRDLEGKSWGSPNGTPLEGYNAYVREVTKIASAKGAKTAVDKTLAEWKADIEKATRAQILAEQNGNEPSPDTGAGRAAPAPKGMAAIGAMKTKEYESLGKTPQERYAALVGNR